MKKINTIPEPDKHGRGLICFIILVFAGTNTGKNLAAQALYQLQYPFSTSQYGGAEFHILVHHELSRLENRYIPSRIFNSEDTWAKTGNILYRLLRMSTCDFYLAYLPVVNQHEYFGHLARAKQLHAGFTRHEIYFFPPTGGKAYYGDHKYKTLTDAERISEYIGGMEASIIMAGTIRRNLLREELMSFQDAMLYLGSNTDFNTYVLFEDNGSADDVTQYLTVLNQLAQGKKIIDRRALILPSIFSILLDPVTIHSVSNLVEQYLIGGNTSFDTPPMFSFSSIGLLPYYSFEPGAYGPRHCLNSYIRNERDLYYICFHKGAFNFKKDLGIQVALYGCSLVSKTLNFDLDLRYWRGGSFEYHNDAGSVQNSKLHGALLSSKLYFHPTRKDDTIRDLFFSSGISIKTQGYTKGYPLSGGLSFSFGIGYSA